MLTLCGHIGKKGSGITGFPFLHIAGVDGFSQASGSLPPAVGMLGLALDAAPTMLKSYLAGHGTEMMMYELVRREYARGQITGSPLYFYKHGGLEESFGSAARYDPTMKREFADYVNESIEKGRQNVPKTPAKIFFEAGGNFLRRVRHYDRLIENFLPKLDLLVTLDWRMSNTARMSDYVLPAAGWYEKDDITWGTPIAPFGHVVTRAVEPWLESKSDWAIHCLYLKKLQQRARRRGVSIFRDRSGEERRLDSIYDDFTFKGRYTEDGAETLLTDMFEMASNMGGISWEAIKDKGYARYTELGLSFVNLGNATDIEPDQTITANTWHTRDKQPWPTLTRRLQFYIDQEYFLELEEELPTHKDNPAIGGDYPLSITGGHARWSIHASWRDESHLLQLQRGEPLMFMSAADSAARGIADGEIVRAYNDVGSFQVMARVSASVRPGQVIVYHGWEPYQFRGHESHQVLMPSPLNPLQAAGGYFHLQPTMVMGEPGLNDRGTRVEVERLEA